MSSVSRYSRRVTVVSETSETAGMLWGCDDPSEGTLHTGWEGPSVAEEAHSALIRALDQTRALSRHAARERRAEGEARSRDSNERRERADVETTPMERLLEELDYFTLCPLAEGGGGLKLYDAMQNPDKLLVKHGYFVAEVSPPLTAEEERNRRRTHDTTCQILFRQADHSLCPSPPPPPFHPRRVALSYSRSSLLVVTLQSLSSRQNPRCAS